MEHSKSNANNSIHLYHRLASYRRNPTVFCFWSKDEVLLAAWNENKIAWAMLLIAAIMTVLHEQTCFHDFLRGKKWGISEHEETEADEETDTGDGQEHEIIPHESPTVMWIPLVILSGLAAVAGLLNLPFSYDTKHLEHWLEPILFGNEVHVTASGQTKWILAIVAIIGATTGVLAAAFVYLKTGSQPTKLSTRYLKKHGDLIQRSVTLWADQDEKVLRPNPI